MSRDFPFMLSLSKHSESFFSNLLREPSNAREFWEILVLATRPRSVILEGQASVARTLWCICDKNWWDGCWCYVANSIVFIGTELAHLTGTIKSSTMPIKRFYRSILHHRADLYLALSSPSFGIAWSVVTFLSGLLYLIYDDHKRDASNWRTRNDSVSSNGRGAVQTVRRINLA